VKDVLLTKTEPMIAPLFKFQPTAESAEHNFQIIKNHHFNLERCLNTTPPSSCKSGSEFKPVHVLEPLLHQHPNWPFLKSALTTGTPIIYNRLPSDQQRIQENNAMLEYNNHKKTKENHQLVVETVHKEVCKGWVLILPKKILPHLPYAMICPMGIVEQINYNLTFGGSTNPAAWRAMSEAQTDLANDILADKSWQIADFMNDEAIKHLPPIARLPDSLPFAPALPMMVLPPPRAFGQAEMFLDNGDCIVVDMANNVVRPQVGVKISIDTLGRPINQEVLPRDPLIEGTKTDELGNPNEIQLYLGWIHNYRALTVSLPADKCQAWKLDISKRFFGAIHHKKN
jgi:hypothetical protein